MAKDPRLGLNRLGVLPEFDGAPFPNEAPPAKLESQSTGRTTQNAQHEDGCYAAIGLDWGAPRSPFHKKP